MPVVVPTYQEAENVAELLARLRASVPYADVLVVDDNSPDGTADIVDAIGRELGNRVSTLRRAAKSGLGAAYRAGFETGITRGYTVLVQMDADLSHDPAALPEMLRTLERGADLVIGSRYARDGTTPDWPLRRRLLSHGGNTYVCRMLRLPVRDATSGFRVVRSDVLEAIRYRSLEARGYGFLIEQTYRAAALGARIEEVPIRFADRRRGTSKLSPGIVAEALSLVTRWGARDRLVRHRRDGREPVHPALT